MLLINRRLMRQFHYQDLASPGLCGYRAGDRRRAGTPGALCTFRYTWYISINWYQWVTVWNYREAALNQNPERAMKKRESQNTNSVATTNEEELECCQINLLILDANTLGRSLCMTKSAKQ